MSPEVILPSVLIKAIDDNCKLEPAKLAELRIEFVKFWLKRALQLRPEEIKLHESMDPAISVAVKGKRILLFEEMLKACEFPDPGVSCELKDGVDLIGNVGRTGMLPVKFKPPLCSEEALKKTSKRLRPMLQSNAFGSGDAQIDQTVWDKTLEEVSMGWLEGPLPDSAVPEDAPISRRFGLLQKKGKVRLIDDYSESQVNSCVGTTESPVLHTVDIACALFLIWSEYALRHGIKPDLNVRTFDLKSAYRQVGLSAAGKGHAFLKVFCPHSSSYKLFRNTVLPFGAVRSVHAFLRLARALWWLGVVGLKLLWTSFYDDFICFSRAVATPSSENSVVSLFRLTGWLFAESGDKCQPFDLHCEALGVVFNVCASNQGRMEVGNTNNRIAELVADISLVIEKGKLLAKDAQRLRGRMQFAESQVYGKTGKRCLRVLNEFATGSKTKLGNKDIFFLELFKKLLQRDTPRLVRPLPSCNALVFTDACYERESRDWVCGLGGVLFLPDGTSQTFSVQLDEDERNLMGELRRKQIIFEAETLAALLALSLWAPLLVAFKSFFFVDNEGAKFSLLRSISDNVVVDFFAGCFAEIEMEFDLLLWLCRVPSKSNVADEPSRNLPVKIPLAKNSDVSSKAHNEMKGILRRLKERGEELRSMPKEK